MKIAMIGHKRIPGREGGVEVAVEELAVRMAAMGHRVVVYNRNDFRHQTVKRYRGVKIVNIPTFPNRKLNAVVYSFLATVHALFGHYDVIHYHAIGPAVMLAIPRAFGIRTVVTVHGLNYKTPKWKGFAVKYLRLGEKITAKYADEIIVLSRDCQRYFMERYRRETHYIPNGVVLRPIAAADEIQSLFHLKKDGYLLYLSRIVPGKGIEYLLDAYRNIKVPYKLVLAGDSRQVKNFYEGIRKKAAQDPRVILTGFVQGNLLDELYANCRLFIFPSEAEGMPISLLEAMSYNCRCIVSDIPENKEVGKDYVSYFKSKDTASLEHVIRESLARPGRRTETRGYVRQNFDWDKAARQTVSLYRGHAPRKRRDADRPHGD